MPLVLDSVVLPNGLRLSFVEQGDPGGVPVVLLHGITDSCRSFEPVLAWCSGELGTPSPGTTRTR